MEHRRPNPFLEGQSGAAWLASLLRLLLSQVVSQPIKVKLSKKLKAAFGNMYKGHRLDKNLEYGRELESELI